MNKSKKISIKDVVITLVIVTWVVGLVIAFNKGING
jgi:hypothetical protein